MPTALPRIGQQPTDLFFGLRRKCNAVAMGIDRAFDYLAAARGCGCFAWYERNAVIAVHTFLFRNVLVLRG